MTVSKTEIGSSSLINSAVEMSDGKNKQEFQMGQLEEKHDKDGNGKASDSQLIGIFMPSPETSKPALCASPCAKQHPMKKFFITRCTTTKPAAIVGSCLAYNRCDSCKKGQRQQSRTTMSLSVLKEQISALEDEDWGALIDSWSSFDQLTDLRQILSAPQASLLSACLSHSGLSAELNIEALLRQAVHTWQ
ncbi:hypothetical protein llap_2043 [Limosa lapponica baueri]|uniref:Uncharacterized protein n=1 Tax=Limosa lapponica baueri TaxID=1758121 RepID=A0A2I0UNR1_LIMLA|nr:hypothetical protein llap_2043 [Limosa lapponica baueri]